MKKIIAVAMLLVATHSFADPTSYVVKSGTLLTDEDKIVEVDSGLYLNDDAVESVNRTMNLLISQNRDMAAKLGEANQKILDADAYIPGIPTWLGVLASVALSVLTIGVGFMAAKEVAGGK